MEKYTILKKIGVGKEGNVYVAKTNELRPGDETPGTPTNPLSVSGSFYFNPGDAAAKPKEDSISGATSLLTKKVGEDDPNYQRKPKSNFPLS